MALKPLFDSIVDAIHEKDGLADGIAAVDFPRRIREIPSGSGGGLPQTAMTPAEVYRRTRPADWLPMPVPADDEIYLLVLVPDGATTLLAFTVTCTDRYTVELGTVQDGAFASSGSTSVSSGSKYETELFASQYDNLTSDGMKQVMVKISGTGIKTWTTSTHSKRTNFTSWSIVDIRCRLPNGTKMGVSTKDNLNNTLIQLRYFSWEGPNQLTDASYMFNSCYALAVLLELDTSKVTSMTHMFHYCYNLLTIPQLDASASANISHMFSNCYTLMHIPDLNTRSAANMEGAFKFNFALTTAPRMDLSSATNLSEMFYGCMSLRFVPTMSLTRVTTMKDIFTSAFAIGAITFDPDVTGWSGCDIVLSNQPMGHDALVVLLKSLPVVSTQRTLNIIANYGASSLTEEEKAIATNKNWALTM